jgi:tRNA(Ile)-lysidine synthase TilS/MesJ
MTGREREDEITATMMNLITGRDVDDLAVAKTSAEIFPGFIAIRREMLEEAAEYCSLDWHSGDYEAFRDRVGHGLEKLLSEVPRK